MHQQTHGPGVGDRVEILGRMLRPKEKEYDGSSGEVLNVFSDRGTRCATVRVESENKARAGKRPFPMAALKKL